MKTKYLFALFLIVLLLAGCAQSSSKAGTKSNSVTGNSVKKVERIEITGSDTLLQMVSNLAEAHSKTTDARISVTGGGSGTGIAALLNGEVDIADASRAIKDSELKTAESSGMRIWEVIVARDMLSVIVNPANPVKQLPMDTIGKIYRGEITNWKEVGGPDIEITLYGRQSTSGTYAFFMEHVLEGDYSPTMRNLEGNQAILDAVKQDKSGIGYVGIGYIVDSSGKQVSGISILKVKGKGGEYYSPLDKSTIEDYPISRPLYQYLSKAPVKGSALYEFIMFELSETGQKIVQDTGFVELTTSDNNHNAMLLKKI